MRRLQLCIFFLLLTPALWAGQTFSDRTHYSEVFGQNRNYRLFLPANYESDGKSYPVIYYFHGHSDRYTLEHYDDGTVTVPKIADYVSKHDVIVVAVDGYVAEHYTGFYGGTPWDIRLNGGDYDFGEYFLELIAHIDSTLRTRTDRRYRGTSGLSMGGFMSLYLSARYPDVVGSASSFNPGPEFYVGDKGRRTLWRPKDHVSSHQGRWVRLIRASGDYISQYHEELREVYARADQVKFEYRRDEYHRHAATSIAETFDFHLKAFQDPTLNNVPVSWNYASPCSSFSVWGYQVEAPGAEKAIVYLTDVRQGGLRITTRRWAPDGPPLQERRISVRTAPLYRANSDYTLIDLNLSQGERTSRRVRTDAEGRIGFEVNGSGHQISLVGPGTGSQSPVLLPLTERDRLYLPPGIEVELPVRVYNPRDVSMKEVTVGLSSRYPTVEVLQAVHTIDEIGPGSVVDLTGLLTVKFTSGAGYFAPTRLHLGLTYDGWQEVGTDVDVSVIPEVISQPAGIEILDGRTVTLRVFRQAGNQGGGSAIEREVSEGSGNGNGVLEPGEEATIWVKMVQGLDPFDKNNWYRCKVRSNSPWLNEVADIQEQKQLEWTSAKNRSSVVRMAPEAPSGERIPLILENETWSYHYTPDVRFGVEKLYQAFQLHTFHLHRYELVAP